MTDSKDHQVIVGLAAGSNVEDWSQDFALDTKPTAIAYASHPSRNKPRLSIPVQPTSTDEIHLDEATSDSDEDWDMEMGLLLQSDAGNSFSLMMEKARQEISSATQEVTTSIDELLNPLPENIRWSKGASAQQNLTIEKYPAPSVFFTKEMDCPRQYETLDGQKLEKWLRQQQEKHAPHKDNDGENDFEKLMQIQDWYNEQNLRKCVAFLHSPHRFRKQTKEMDGIAVIRSVFRFLKDHSNQAYSVPTTYLFLRILQIAGALWEPERMSVYSAPSTSVAFSDLVGIALQVFPTCTLTIALIELRFVAHHIDALLHEDAIYSWVVQAATTSEDPHQLPMDGEGETTAAIYLFDNYVCLYLKAKEQAMSSSRTSLDVAELEHSEFNLSTDPFSIQILVLIDMYLCSSGISPLSYETSFELLNIASQDEDDFLERFTMSFRSKTPEGFTQEMATGFEQRFHSPKQSNQYEMCCQLRGNRDFRIKLLYGSFSFLVTNNLRNLVALSAFTFSHYLYHCHQETLKPTAIIDESNPVSDALEVAEQFIFEGLRVLDSIDGDAYAFMYIGYIFKTQAYELFGDTLLHRNKYRFSVIAHEIAMDCHYVHYRNPHYRLIRRLCTICSNQNDLERSLRFHTEILNQAKKNVNLNEIVYISEEISKLFVRQNSFKEAEAIILNTLEYLGREIDHFPTPFIRIEMVQRPAANVLKRGHHRRISSGDLDGSLNHFIRLHFQLAQLYSQQQNWNQASSLYQYLLSLSRLPAGKRTEIEMRLALSLLKERRLRECFETLRSISQAYTDDDVASIQENFSSFLAGVHGDSFLGSNKSTITLLKNTRFLVCRAKCHFYAKDHLNALHWIALAFAFEAKLLRPRIMAKLHLLKARILREVLAQLKHTTDSSIALRGDIADMLWLDPSSDRWLTGQLSMEEEQVYNEVFYSSTIAFNVESGMTKQRIKDALVESISYDMQQAYDHYVQTNDMIRQNHVLNELIEFQQEAPISAFLLHRIPHRRRGSQDIDPSPNIQKWLSLAFRECQVLLSPRLMIPCLLNLAEYQLIRHERELSIDTWKEAVSLFRGIYCDTGHSGSILRLRTEFSLGTRLKLGRELFRCLKLLFCYSVQMSSSSSSSGSDLLRKHDDMFRLWMTLDYEKHALNATIEWPYIWSISTKATIAVNEQSSKKKSSSLKLKNKAKKRARHRKAASLGNNFLQTVGALSHLFSSKSSNGNSVTTTTVSGTSTSSSRSSKKAGRVAGADESTKSKQALDIKPNQLNWRTKQYKGQSPSIYLEDFLQHSLSSNTIFTSRDARRRASSAPNTFCKNEDAAMSAAIDTSASSTAAVNFIPTYFNEDLFQIFLLDSDIPAPEYPNAPAADGSSSCNLFYEFQIATDKYTQGKLDRADYAKLNLRTISRLLEHSSNIKDGNQIANDQSNQVVDRENSNCFFTFTSYCFYFSVLDDPIQLFKHCEVQSGISSVKILIEKFGLANLLNVVACLIGESSSLLVIGVAPDEISYAVVEILLLLRPVGWKHLCIPYLSGSSASHFIMQRLPQLYIIGVSCTSYYEYQLLDLVRPSSEEREASNTIILNVSEQTITYRAPSQAIKENVFFPTKLAKQVVEKIKNSSKASNNLDKDLRDELRGLYRGFADLFLKKGDGAAPPSKHWLPYLSALKSSSSFREYVAGLRKHSKPIKCK